MRRAGWRILLAVSLCLNLGFVSALVIHRFHHRRSHDAPELKLRPEVQATLDANYEAFRARLSSLHNDLHAERGKLVALLATQDPSPEAVKAQQDRILAANDRIIQAFTEHLLNQKRLLTPQEQRLFFDHIQSRKPQAEHRGTPSP